ncbi:MAG: hypothetical protein Q8P20_01835 [bacterium]|nr:hypothetical protein [bacterium]
MELSKETTQKLDEFLVVMKNYHSEKTTPIGFYNAIGRIEKDLVELNGILKSASKSADRLTSALNKITLAGVIIAGIGIIISVINIVN